MICFSTEKSTGKSFSLLEKPTLSVLPLHGPSFDVEYNLCPREFYFVRYDAERPGEDRPLVRGEPGFKIALAVDFDGSSAGANECIVIPACCDAASVDYFLTRRVRILLGERCIASGCK